MTAKNWFFFLVVCILAVFLNSCQSSTPTQAVLPATTQATTTTGGTYPQPTVATASTAYPEPQISSEPGNWSDVAGLLKNGDVTKVIQSHNLNVYLTLKDGRTLKVTEPAYDDIVKLIIQCGDTCKQLAVDNP